MKRIKNSGVKADVLDIGTGSGILAMMAAASGADYVTACEVSVCNAFNCQQNYVILYQLTNNTLCYEQLWLAMRLVGCS